jgi:hypothetical protein
MNKTHKYSGSNLKILSPGICTPLTTSSNSKYIICEIKQNNKNEYQTDQTGCRYGLLYDEETCKNSLRTDVSQAS